MTVIDALTSRRKKLQPAQGSAPPPPKPESKEAEEQEELYKPIDFALIRRLGKWIRPYRKQYLTGVIGGMLIVLLEMQSPHFMQMMIDAVTGYLGHRPGAPASETAAIHYVVGVIGMWGVVMALAFALQRWTVLTMTKAGENVQFDLRRAVFAHLQTLSMSYYDKTKLGRIISRCTSDIASLREINVWGISSVVNNTLMVIFSAAWLLYTDWRLFLSVSWLGIVLLLAHRVYRRKAARYWQVVREGWTKVSTNLAENITGIRVVTAFNRQVMNLGVFNSLQEVNTANNVQMARINGVYQPMLQMIGITGKIIILLFGGYLVINGRIKTVGAVVAAFMYWDWFMNPILNFGNLSNMLMQAMAGAERVFDLLDMKPDVQDLPLARPLGRIEGRVEFERVTFGYNPERPVLHDVSFVTEPGKTCALVGATGSGKSSIISLIARFYQPQAGRVLVDGQDIRHVTGDSLHRQMGLVLQVNYLFSGTVMENIRYAKPDASDEQVIQSARDIGSYDTIMSLNDGFNTQVGERGASMSLGQRQLICFTRAFLADPRIFMLDEATSAVDTGTERLVQNSLEKLLQGRTTFIVAHRLSTILSADCILVVDAGKIIERGTHRELLAHGGKYAHLYEQFVKHTE
ncbi:MAG TPA: ABC transporter ATP-binding protein [Tepidisphaeraceae bacterium]|jgi:ATP-binding cassette subfamily B protein